MTDTEDKRDSDQRRISDTYLQMESLKANARNQGLLTFCAVGTLFGTVILYMASSVAKSEIEPTREKALKNEVHISNMQTQIMQGQNQILDILKSMRDK